MHRQRGFEHVPVFPHDVRNTPDIVSPVPTEAICAHHEAVEAACPI